MQITIENGEIVIRVPYDAKASYGTSKSGKSLAVASSGGFVAVPGAPDVRVNLNVIKKR